MDLSEFTNKIELLDKDLQTELMSYLDYLLYKEKKVHFNKMINTEKIKQVQHMLDERDINYR